MTIKVEKTMETCKNGVMDDLDRRIAVALQGNGRASWQQVARVVESSESTVARRAHRMFEAGLLRVAAISDPVRCGFGYPVLVQLRCEVGEEMRVAHALADRSDVRFVALVTGSFDIVMELIVPSRRYLAGVLLEDLPKVGGIEDTTTETVLRNFKMTYDWSRELLGADGGQLEEPVVDRDGSNGSGLDGVDLQLYELLAEDGRRSFSDLASLVGMSESVVRRRAVPPRLRRGVHMLGTRGPLAPRGDGPDTGRTQGGSLPLGHHRLQRSDLRAHPALAG
jgi:DNA-binding Lrp family transcriptional regulator